VLKATFAADPRVRKEPPIWANVDSLADSSVNLRIRAWCGAKDMQDLRGDMLKKVKQAFDQEKITIPYPHQTHVDKYPQPAAPASGDAPKTPGNHADKSG
jgi:small conductance mechanosensitive channel